jgi:hypothetical protein
VIRPAGVRAGNHAVAIPRNAAGYYFRSGIVCTRYPSIVAPAMHRPASDKFSYNFAPAHRLCLVRFSGSVSLSDITAGLEKLWGDPDYDPGFNGIVTLDGVTTRAGLDELQALITFLHGRRSSDGRWVAVFSEPKPTALGMMFKAAWRGSFNIEIVSTWEAACRLLQVNIPSPVAAS